MIKIVESGYKTKDEYLDALVEAKANNDHWEKIDNGFALWETVAEYVKDVENGNF